MTDDVTKTEKALGDAQRTAMTILQSQEPITDEIIDQAIEGALASIRAMRAVYGDVEIDRPAVRRYIEERVSVWTAEQSSLGDDRDHVPWLETERGSIEWRFWERYRSFIADDLSPAAVR